MPTHTHMDLPYRVGYPLSLVSGHPGKFQITGHQILHLREDLIQQHLHLLLIQVEIVHLFQVIMSILH